MSEKKCKSPFAVVSTFANIKKLQTSKTGRELVITGFILAGKQFDEIDDLTAHETEVMVTIQPARRGTLYAGQDVEHRLLKDRHSYEQDAITELVIEASNAMRNKMISKHSEGVTGWDDEERKDEFLLKAADCIGRGDYIDAMNYLMFLRNLEKPVLEVEEQLESTEEPTLFDEEDKQLGSQDSTFEDNEADDNEEGFDAN